MLEVLQKPFKIVTRTVARKEDVVDLIVNHYRKQEAKSLKPLPEQMPSVLSTVTMGLGDTVMLTDLPRAAAQQKKDFACYSGSQHFLPLMSFNPWFKQRADKAFMVNAPDLVRQYDCGNGHYLQRIRRAFGLKVDDCPRGCIAWRGSRSPNRVILHFEPGVHVNWQRKTIHPKARHLYSDTKIELEKFIREMPGYQFVQLGKQNLFIKGSQWVQTQTTVDLVNQIGQASWFIGIMSGPMHVATALELKCVVVCNFPEAEKIVLPTLKVTGNVEEEWQYGMNVHLHQDGESQLVPKANSVNLHRAFDGQVYPFWSRDYLSLIHECIP